MPYQITDSRYAELNDVPLATTAWWQQNLMDLFKPAETRGSDTEVIPGAHGGTSYPRWKAPTRRQIILSIFNDRDADGSVHPTWVNGWIRNVTALKAATEPADSADGTVSLVLHLGDEGDWSADVLIIGFDYDDTAGTGVIDIEIPMGELTEVASV